jgi:diketogulonate reductase-like aldo/keto reductase
MITMKQYSLSSGFDLPAIGFGTWEIPSRQAAEAVSQALKVGYRLVDTAKIYGNEKAVGAAIKESGIPREEIFVTTKLWNSDQGYDSALKAFDKSLERLGLDYIDLYLIHWPVTSRRQDSWRALSEINKSGRARAVGVSNYTVSHLVDLQAEGLAVPAVNQVEFHPFIYDQQKELLDYCKKYNILIEAYSPLSRLNETNNATIKSVAERAGKTPQQVVLRWCLQHGTLPLPRSTNPEHIRSNLEIFDFELTNKEMLALNSISDGQRVAWDPTNIE